MAPREVQKTAAAPAQSPARRICVLKALQEIQETAAALHRLLTMAAVVSIVQLARSSIMITALVLTTPTTVRTSTVQQMATSLIIAHVVATLTLLNTAQIFTVMTELMLTTQLAAA